MNNNKPKWLECRLVHKDYDVSLNEADAEKTAQQAEKELLDGLLKTFGLTNAKVGNGKVINDYDVWYYSSVHATGTTMIFFAHWPVGLSCIYNKEIPDNYKDNFDIFNQSELEWLKKNEGKIAYAKLLMAKAAFDYCYYLTYNTKPNYEQWSVKEVSVNMEYSNGKEQFICEQGIGGNKYTFFVCHKKD